MDHTTAIGVEEHDFLLGDDGWECGHAGEPVTVWGPAQIPGRASVNRLDPDGKSLQGAAFCFRSPNPPKLRMQLAVVIPLYNHEHFIGEALRSVLEQTLPVDRVVIIDDGSSDGSVAAVQQFQDDRIRLITQPNAGAHVALNRGIALAAEECEFIAILNSDDVFESNRLEKCVGFLKEHPELELVCTQMRLIDRESKFLPTEDPKVRWIDRVWKARRPDLPEWLGIANFAKTSSNFVARAAYLREHPLRAYRYVHDYYAVLDAALHGRLGIVDEELLRYRTHATNTIKSGGKESVTREVLAMNLDLFRELGPEMAASAELRAAMASYFRTLVQNHGEFRVEVFLALVAGLLVQEGEAGMAECLAGVGAIQFPELAAAKGSALKEEETAREYEALVHGITNSRWFALGRVFGGVPPLPDPDLPVERRLAALKRGCAGSSWLRLGKGFGLKVPVF